MKYLLFLIAAKDARYWSDAMSSSCILSSSSSLMSLSIESLFAQTSTLFCSFWKPKTEISVTSHIARRAEKMARFIVECGLPLKCSIFFRAGNSMMNSKAHPIISKMSIE